MDNGAGQGRMMAGGMLIKRAGAGDHGTSRPACAGVLYTARKDGSGDELLQRNDTGAAEEARGHGSGDWLSEGNSGVRGARKEGSGDKLLFPSTPAGTGEKPKARAAVDGIGDEDLTRAGATSTEETP